MNIFILAHKQLEREGLLNKPNETLNLIDRAVKIRKYLDLQERGRAIAKSKRRV